MTLARLPSSSNVSPVAYYLAGLAAGPSRRTMASALRMVATLLESTVDRLEWHRLRYTHSAALRAALVAQDYAPATANRMLAALRGVLRECFRLGLMTHDAYRRACMVAPIQGSRIAAGRALSSGELRQLFAVCELGTLAGRRDAAVLACAYGAGLRRSEICALERGHVRELGGGDTALELRIRGKGDRARIAHLTGNGARAMRYWLADRGDRAGALFCRVRRGAFELELEGRPARITEQAIADILARRARQAGLEHATPHDLRRTFVGDLLDAGADLPTVQRMAGHRQPTTTSQYDRRGARATRRAADLIVVPLPGR